MLIALTVIIALGLVISILTIVMCTSFILTRLSELSTCFDPIYDHLDDIVTYLDGIEKATIQGGDKVA